MSKNVLKNVKKKVFLTEPMSFKVTKEEKDIINGFMREHGFVKGSAIRTILLDFIKNYEGE